MVEGSVEGGQPVGQLAGRLAQPAACGDVEPGQLAEPLAVRPERLEQLAVQHVGQLAVQLVGPLVEQLVGQQLVEQLLLAVQPAARPVELAMEY